jgi:hypothetical protein
MVGWWPTADQALHVTSGRARVKLAVSGGRRAAARLPDILVCA